MLIKIFINLKLWILALFYDKDQNSILVIVNSRELSVSKCIAIEAKIYLVNVV
jgi:hypothetical protein